METATEQTTNLRTTKILKWVPIVKIVIMCGGSVFCFMLAFSNGSVSAYVPFITETGAHNSEMVLFSLTLYFGAAAGVVTILYRFLIIRYQLKAIDNCLNKINRVSTIFGLTSMIGLVGVAAAPMSTVLPLHLIFVITYFLFALMYVNLQTTISYFIPGGNTIWNRIRDVLCLLLLVFMILLIIFFPLSHFKWGKAKRQPLPALKTPENPYFGLMVTSSVLEWLLYVSFLTIISSFYFEFRNFEFTFGIVPRQNEAPVTTAEEIPMA